MGAVWSGKGVADRLPRPGGGRMVGHIQMNNAAAVVGEDDEDEQDAEGRCGDREEIHRCTLRQMRPQERAPGRRRSPAEIRGDGRFGDLDAQLPQFAVKAWGTPDGIGAMHRVD